MTDGVAISAARAATTMTEDTIGVVLEADALTEAYRKGYDSFDGHGEPTTEPHEAVSAFKDTATWANSVAPTLRALSGYVDNGKGTFTAERPVALVAEGDEGDTPMDAEPIGVLHVFEALVSAFDVGAVDALDGRDADASRAERV